MLCRLVVFHVTASGRRTLQMIAFLETSPQNAGRGGEKAADEVCVDEADDRVDGEGAEGGEGEGEVVHRLQRQ